MGVNMNARMYLIGRIIFTFLFLIISTKLWLMKDFSIYHSVESSIISNNIVISNLKHEIESDNIYNLKIENKEDKLRDIKVYIVSDLLSENISNNYIKYQIDSNKVKTLNMDGVIMVSRLSGFEKKDINLKIWISDTYDGNLNYNGRVIVA